MHDNDNIIIMIVKYRIPECASPDRSNKSKHCLMSVCPWSDDDDDDDDDMMMIPWSDPASPKLQQLPYCTLYRVCTGTLLWCRWQTRARARRPFSSGISSSLHCIALQAGFWLFLCGWHHRPGIYICLTPRRKRTTSQHHNTRQDKRRQHHHHGSSIITLLLLRIPVHHITIIIIVSMNLLHHHHHFCLIYFCT